MFSHAEVFKRIQGGFYRKSTLSKTKGSNRSWQYNNGRRDETLAKPSIRERLEDAKRECAEHRPWRRDAPAVTRRSMMIYEPEQEMATGMGLLPGGERA